MKYSREQIKHIHRSDCLNFEQFDKKYNVDTASPIIPAEDNPDIMKPWWEDNSDVLPGSEGYQPIPLYWMDLINKFFMEIQNENLSFVDIGTGKGKPILYNILKNAPYNKYIGIEADPKYASIFKDNLKNTSININKPVEALEIDALTFDYSNNDYVYFMFQPFTIDLFQKFLDKHINTLMKTNSYIACVMIDKYETEKRLGMDPVFREGLLAIYRFPGGE